MVSDYAFNGRVGTTLELLLNKPQIRTYYYKFSYSGSHSVCDKDIYYGWKYSLKLQIQNLGLGYNLRNGYGTCQGDELLSLFVFSAQPPPINLGPLSNEDKIVSQRLVSLWTSFANTTFPSNSEFYWDATEKTNSK